METTLKWRSLIDHLEVTFLVPEAEKQEIRNQRTFSNKLQVKGFIVSGVVIGG
jgi:hypothetical protein